MIADLLPRIPSESKRVAVVAYTEYPWDPRVRREAEALLQDGYAVHVIALRSRSETARSHINGVCLHQLPLSPRRGGKLRYMFQYVMFFLLSTTELFRLHVHGRLDLVHVHSLPDFQVFCAFPLKLARTAVLLDLHEGFPEILAARFHLRTKSLLVRIAASLEQLSCRFADHVIAANDGVRSAVISRGLSSARITSVYNSGEAPGILPSVETLRQRFDLPSGRLIVHAGGVNPERDLETLVRALAALPPEVDAHLIMAGDGDPGYLESLRDLAKNLEVTARVRFVGRLAWEQAFALMSLSSVGVVTLASNPLTQIAWPTRIVEYATLEKPLIVPRFPLLQEILGEGAQYYTPGDPASLADALRGILLAPSTRQSAIAKAAAVCRRFTSPNMRETLLGIVRGLEGSHAA